MELSSVQIIAFVTGICSHYLYFIHGEHLTSIPMLLLIATLLFGFCVASLHLQLSITIELAISIVAKAYAAYLTALAVSITTYRAFFHRLHSVPGPFGARLSKFYHVYAVRRLDQYRWLDKLHNQYGPVVRVGPNSVSVSDPHAVEAVHGARSKCVKSALYDISLPVTNLQQLRDRAMHDRRRKTGGWDKAFSAKSLESYDERLLKYATLLEDALASSLGKVVNISDQLSWYTFDIMGDLTFGRSFSGLESQSTHWAIESIRESGKALGLLGPVPWLIHLMTKLPNFLNPMQKLILFSEESVEKRRQIEPSEQDIMSHLLEGDRFFEDATAEHHLLTGDARLLIIGGSDTTASALAFLFYHLATDPSLQSNLVSELKSQNLTSSEEISVQAVKDLPYLNALINETLRLHPPVPSAPVRDTPPEGLQIGNDIFIPADTTVYTPLYSIHRSPEAFKQPDAFIPERWTTRPELILNKRAFAPFLIGAYSCIGRQLAYAEMRTVVCKLMLRFEVKLAEGETGQRLMHDSVDVFTMQTGGLDVVFKARGKK